MEREEQTQSISRCLRDTTFDRYEQVDPSLQPGADMRMKMFHPIIMLLVLFFLEAPIHAHHGTAAYDMSKSLTLKGVVTSYEFVNPHAEIRVAVTDENGRTVNWLAETNNPNRLARRGWNRNVLKAGDVITIVGNPVKSGAPSLRLTKVVLADGTELDPL
jgi:hypothetical protein